MTLSVREELSGGDKADLRPLLIVTGLLQEARIATGAGLVVCSSSNTGQLRSLLTLVDPNSIRGVISFGVAGGLDPDLRTGDVVVASDVMAGAGRWGTLAALNEDLVNRLTSGRRRVVSGTLVGAEEVLVGHSFKAVLRSETGAIAVDMESHIAAAYAEEVGLPFAALRVISDPAHRALPALARGAIKPNGQVDLAVVLRGVARNPGLLRELVITGLDFSRALRELKGCRKVLSDRDVLSNRQAWERERVNGARPAKQGLASQHLAPQAA